jgi:hypothetical protein
VACLCPTRAGRVKASVALGDRVIFEKLAQKPLKLGQGNHVRSIRWRMVGIFMSFNEHRRNADRDSRPGQNRHKLALAP